MARISKEQNQFKQPSKDIIFCEDTKSSAIYIDLMKQKFRKSIEIRTCNGGSPLENIKLAINIIENERSPEYNNKFCIFDLDLIQSQNELEECKKLANDECEKLMNNKELNNTAFERNKKVYKLGHNKTNFYEVVEFVKSK